MSAADESGWWLGIPAAEATLACGEHTHRLRWERGELHVLDHDNAEAERTLAALSDQRCACIETLDAWARHRADLRVLALASRGSADPLAAEEQQEPPGRGRVRGGFAIGRRGAAVAPAASTGEAQDELVALLSLGSGLPERLAATVAAEWIARQREYRPEHAHEHERERERARERAQLEAALYGRATAAVRSWLGQPEQQIELRIIDDGEQPALARHEDGLVRVQLPLTWLTEVFARGLAVTWGRFCLAASTGDGRHWTLATVTPELGGAQQITVELPSAE